MNPTVLLIEDEPTLVKNIRAYLEREGFAVEMASSGEVGLKILARVKPSVVLLDYSLPGIDGLAVLGRIMAEAPNTQVIMMTAHGSEETAVKALTGGAADYLKKPLQLGALRLVIERVLRRRRDTDKLPVKRAMGVTPFMDTMQRRRKGDLLNAQKTSWRGSLVLEPAGLGDGPAPPRAMRLQADDFNRDSLLALVGESASMHTLKALIGKINESDARMSGRESPAVLITGETGVGKELVAGALHHGGRRRAGPFVEINCGGIPASIIEAELFGYERGAFTDAKEVKPGLIESAAGGTLFLDEIGDLDLPSQAKLLRVLEGRRVRRLGSLQERSVDVRFVAATSRDLEKMVREGLFRADLYFRLCMIHVQVPPLRERGIDVLGLTAHFMAGFTARYAKPDLRLSSEAMAVLTRHSWPGNVRELKNTIERAVALSAGSVIGVEDISLQAAPLGVGPQPGPDSNFYRNASMNLHEVEREMLISALSSTGTNVSKAARLLGISRDTLRYRAKKYSINTSDEV